MMILITRDYYDDNYQNHDNTYLYKQCRISISLCYLYTDNYTIPGYSRTSPAHHKCCHLYDIRLYLKRKNYIVLSCIVLYCIVLYCIVLYCIVLYCIVLYCTVLYCIVLYSIVLYCIV